MTTFIVNNRTDTLKTDINLFFTITDCRFPLSFAGASREFQIHEFVRILTIKFSQWARVNFFSDRKKRVWTYLALKYGSILNAVIAHFSCSIAASIPRGRGRGGEKSTKFYAWTLFPKFQPPSPFLSNFDRNWCPFHNFFIRFDKGSVLRIDRQKRKFSYSFKTLTCDTSILPCGAYPFRPS